MNDCFRKLVNSFFQKKMDEANEEEEEEEEEDDGGADNDDEDFSERLFERRLWEFTDSLFLPKSSAVIIF